MKIHVMYFIRPELLIKLYLWIKLKESLYE
jgi:hypothetical protein